MASQARELANKTTAAAGRKNLIINGAMSVAQRGTSVTAQTGGGIKTVDRFTTETSGATYDHAQSSDAPVGFSNSIKVTVDGAFTPTSGQYLIPFETRLEREDLAHLAYGTSGAKAITLSFWIKSDTTGTYTIDFTNFAQTRRWAQSYTINTADTWEKKTLTWTGDTSFDFGTGTSIGPVFYWWMTAGTNFTSGSLPSTWESSVNTNRAVGVPTSLADNAEFYLTGVQLEVGSIATDFEHRSYGEELALCQRYYQVIDVSGVVATRWKTSYGNTGTLNVYFPTEMRADSAFSSLTTLTSRNLYNMATDSNVTSGGMQAAINFDRDRAASLYIGSAGGSLGGNSGDPMVISGGSETLFAFDAEL